jgi:hippurate hydrolase
VTALQVFVTRRIDIFDPVVITIAKIDGGSTNNVIPSPPTCSAPFARCRRQRARRRTRASHAFAENIARAHECEVESRSSGISSDGMRSQAVGVAERRSAACWPEAWTTMTSPIMGAEDFSYILQRVPG